MRWMSRVRGGRALWDVKIRNGGFASILARPASEKNGCMSYKEIRRANGELTGAPCLPC